MLQLRILISKGFFFFFEREKWCLNEHTANGNEIMKITTTNLERKRINANMAGLKISSLKCITEEGNKDRRLTIFH